MSFHTLSDFLEPVQLAILNNDAGYKSTQLGSKVSIYETSMPDIADADMIIVGCKEMRGDITALSQTNAADEIRKEFYNLFHWHTDIAIADLGNIKTGASLLDTYAALKTVLKELIPLGKKIIILGGSHDVTVAQYNAYADLNKVIEATGIDARIDLDTESLLPSDNFLMDIFTSTPNYLRHYNHIGFQSYFVHPGMLETIDKLRFDCFRVGKVKEEMEEMEPCIRNSHMLSFDIAAIQHAHAPANTLTPNGFTGEEACTLMQYAGASSNISTIGIYGYIAEQDVHALTAKQISHMLWYIMDGINRLKTEASLDDNDSFNEFNMVFTEVETKFLQSKRTGRWWVGLPDGNLIACNYKDYLAAANNDIPERWLRAVERM